MSNSPTGSPSGSPWTPRRIGLKFCGGCAPRYDRVQEVRTMQKELCGMVTLLSPDEENLEAVLIVAGCPTCCVETQHLQPLPLLQIRCEADTRRLIEEIITDPCRDLAGSTLSVG